MRRCASFSYFSKSLPWDKKVAAYAPTFLNHGNVVCKPTWLLTVIVAISKSYLIKFCFLERESQFLFTSKPLFELKDYFCVIT